MKACVFQMPYSKDTALSDEYFEYKINMLEACEEDLDLIVLPEYSEVPCVTETWEETLYYHNKYFDRLLEKCRETARRCKAMVFVNTLSPEGDVFRNTTYCYDREGNLAGKYFKTHIPPVELRKGVDHSYTMEPQKPFLLEMEGIRFAFLTCYDFYFYEATARIALEKPDVIIGCSHQRSDTHSAIEIQCRHLAYHTSAWVLRSSVSFSEDATVCGASMIVSPEGEVLANMRGRFGRATAEIDPKHKYLKPAGFGNPPATHYEYIEIGRNPWQYRNSGPSTVPGDKRMAYPRICAHRGLQAVAPENSMPAFGAAVGVGATEIELDLWTSSDGVLVSCHDSTLDRVSNGTGKIYDKTFAELRALDFSKGFESGLGGIQIPTFEEILCKFAGRVVMNVHMKIWDKGMEDRKFREIVELVRRYDAQSHVYFMSTNAEVLAAFRRFAPDMPICLGWNKKPDPFSQVELAIELGADKVQLFKPYFNEESIRKAHAHGIRCNVFWSNDVEEAKTFLSWGADTILTDDYFTISRATGIQ